MDMPPAIVMPAPILVGADAKPVFMPIPQAMPTGTAPSGDYTWRWMPGVGFAWVHKDIKTPVQTAAKNVVQAVVRPVQTMAPVVQNSGRWVKQCLGNGTCQMVFVRD